MDSTKKLFTTGEFADLCGVKKQTLFHYDDIGLLKPEYRCENKYRYYSVQQLEIFNVIDMLKEIGMSLDEIKNFSQFRTSNNAIELLSEKEKIVKMKIKEMQRTQKLIQNQKKQIEESLRLDFDQFTIEEMETERYILSENILNLPHKDIVKAIMSFLKNIKQAGLIIDNGGALIRQEQVEAGDYLNYSNLYIRTEQPDLAATLIKKAGKYVVGFHKGSYVMIHETYDKIKSYLGKKGFRICGDSFEEYLYLMEGISLNVEDNYVIKIMIKVEEK
ncbi:MerR family transcriptional regulator [Virgibacillus alimentarius]|uniref:DNA-binding transcriptional MerR regulator n=1 Tax=Virgibacillus alimentarius TaxID=698769 RepID=A0ABS4SBJ3_9BACI|nr:MerR family transcriptional regulator [Virgibacillus alimentarius]MBP2258876.1 DNA-binding transcriptional MerR regulator [Virgibacillus alimentarius]